jgi:hypothetical protein
VRRGRQVEVAAGPGACHGVGCLYGHWPIAGPSPLAQTWSFLLDALR